MTTQVGDALTDRQREVLALIWGGATLRGVCESLGLRSTNGANDFVLALIKKGALREAKGRFCPNRYELTPAGLRELGLSCCPTCAGSGTVAA